MKSTVFKLIQYCAKERFKLFFTITEIQDDINMNQISLQPRLQMMKHDMAWGVLHAIKMKGNDRQWICVNSGPKLSSRGGSLQYKRLSK